MDSRRAVGLTAAEVHARRDQFGENRLPIDAGVPGWRLFLRQFASPLVYIVLIAAFISLLLGEIGDVAIIMVVVIADVILGFVQERQAQNTYLALRGLLKPTATVIRDGRRIDVEVWELVPGDVLVLAAGDRVPADATITAATRLALDEAILTGESEPVAKPTGATVFMGATVVTGRGEAVVTATATATELGRIAASLRVTAEADTPLQVRLRRFSNVLSVVVLATTVAILAIGLLLGRGFLDMLRTAIILAIAAVPEGLIIAVTVILVLGMRRILRRHGLVKRLLAVETLGSVTVICTDKTGTLTEGRMRVRRTAFLDEQVALETMVLCNNLEGPVDIALWEHAEGALPAPAQELLDSVERIGEEVFTSEKKYMIATVTGGRFGDAHHHFLKGAPEIVLRMCAVDDATRDTIATTIDAWAADGLRTLALAQRVGGTLEEPHGYTWVGLLGIDDPVRAGVPAAVALATRAGIVTKMVTGDYARTAESIARRVGIDVAGGVLEGDAIAAMSDAQLRERVRAVGVFARIRPAEKLRIIRALQANGDVTAMVGDGVNDAPALRHANIGVVVGTATDVAKESADLILLDSDFATIVASVEEGRVIFDNIRKVIAYVLSNAYAEMLIVLGALILGWPAPLLVAQILWINLICDGPSDIVLGFEPKEAGIMQRRPRRLDEPVLNRLGGGLIAVISAGSALMGLAVFGYYHLVLGDAVLGRSVVFASFAVNSMVYIFAYRSMRASILRMNPVTANKPLLGAVVAGLAFAIAPFVVPPLGRVLGVVALGPTEWLLVVAIALTLLLLVEAAKAVARRGDQNA